jgi:hypothetical protein
VVGTKTVRAKVCGCGGVAQPIRAMSASFTIHMSTLDVYGSQTASDREIKFGYGCSNLSLVQKYIRESNIHIIVSS